MVIYKTFLAFVFVSCCLLLVNGEFIIIPKDTEAATGATVTFSCRSSLANIEWHHHPLGRNVHEPVYQDGFIFNGYKGRFSVTEKENGEYDLVITDVRTSDAGKFTCMEKSEDAVQKTAELIVFEQYPSNKSCAAKFTCTPICDALELACSMKSHGNIIPSMEWQDIVNSHVVASDLTTENGITTSSIHMRTNHASTPSYICQVKYPVDSTLTSQFSWSYSVSASPVATKEEQPQTQSNSNTLIATVVVMTVVICTMFILLMYLLKQKRKAQKQAMNKSFGTEENKKIATLGSSRQSEIDFFLVQIEDEDKNYKGFVPRAAENKGKPIHGLGVLIDEIFLLTRDGCVIEVFDLQNAEFKRAWKVEGLVNPNDMATCPRTNLIFICDWKKAAEDKEIFCVDRNGRVKYQWISENEKGRISITGESHVIVAESWYNTIREYTCSGQLIKKIDTGRQKLHLWHAVKLANGTFVASFGDIHDDIQEICVLDGKGQTLHSTTKETLSPCGIQLSVPRSLSVDKEGNIYVCDLYNGRIILLTAELEYKRLFVTTENGDTLRGPLRVCLHESDSKSQLLVADSMKDKGKWTDGRILVWNLSP